MPLATTLQFKSPMAPQEREANLSLGDPIPERIVGAQTLMSLVKLPIKGQQRTVVGQSVANEGTERFPTHELAPPLPFLAVWQVRQTNSMTYVAFDGHSRCSVINSFTGMWQ